MLEVLPVSSLTQDGDISKTKIMRALEEWNFLTNRLWRNKVYGD